MDGPGAVSRFLCPPGADEAIEVRAMAEKEAILIGFAAEETTERGGSVDCWP